MEELIHTLSAMQKRDNDNRKFHASLQGIDLEEVSAQAEDITDLKGFRAQQEGFGIGEGLGHIVEG